MTGRSLRIKRKSRKELRQMGNERLPEGEEVVLLRELNGDFRNQDDGVERGGRARGVTEGCLRLINNNRITTTHRNDNPAAATIQS